MRESESGQYALALEIVEEKGRLHIISREDATPAADHSSRRADQSLRAAATVVGAATLAGAASADEHYERALSIEDGNPQAAQKAYELCLKANPDHLEARINLGRLLHLAGRLTEAERVYRVGAKADPFIAFNLAVVLEDLQREPEAILAYREALALDPQFADAHFNLARLYERAKDPKASLRHLLAYRRMMEVRGA